MRMILSPMMQRELRVALRKRGIRKARLGAAAAAVGITAFFMLLSLSGARTFGRTLHQWLFFYGLVLGVIRPARLCAGILTQERRSQMLELLFLTGITPLDIFIGKVLGGVLVASSELLAIAPVLAVPFLSGGVSLDLFLATVAGLPLLLLLSVSLSILSSALSADEGGAAFLAAGLGALLSLALPLPYAVGQALTGAPPFSAAWLCLSPVYMVYLIFTGLGTAGAAAFWQSAAVGLLWTLLCLSLAAAVLARSWRSAVIVPSGTSRGLWDGLVLGSQRARRRLRDCVLQRNPFQWLVQRDRRPAVLSWAGLLAICVLWCAGWWMWPRYWPSTINFFITATLMVLLVDGLQLHAAARAIADSRQDGTIELLLTTPLNPAEILDGQFAALQAQFKPVRGFMLVLFVFMLAGGLATRTWTYPALISYCGIWCVLLLWCLRTHRRTTPTAMWVALITGRASYAVYRSQGNAWPWFWIFFNLNHLRSWMSSAASFPSGSDPEVIVVSLIAMVVLLAAAFSWRRQPALRAQLIEQMRSIAQQPVPERDDPRYKLWKNVREPFPA